MSKKAMNGDTVQVHYTGKLENGSLIALLVNKFFFLPKQFFLDLDKSEGSPWFSPGSFFVEIIMIDSPVPL